VVPELPHCAHRSAGVPRRRRGGPRWAGGHRCGRIASLPRRREDRLGSEKAYREKTETRERACLNGLWRWQPGERGLPTPCPRNGGGYFKVPGFLAGEHQLRPEDSQTLHATPRLEGRGAAEPHGSMVSARGVTVPQGWTGRRIALTADYVNSFVVVYLDGRKAGEIRFPAARSISPRVPPRRHTRAEPPRGRVALKGVLLSYADTNSAREVKGHGRPPRPVRRHVAHPARPEHANHRRGRSTPPPQRRIHDRRRAGRLAADVSYSLHSGSMSRAAGGVVREFVGKRSRPRTSSAVAVTLSETWKPEALWDVHRPRNNLRGVRLARRGRQAARYVLPRPVRVSANSGSTAATFT